MVCVWGLMQRTGVSSVGGCVWLCWCYYPHKGDQKLVKTVRSSTQDWSSFQLAITTHQQSFTHNGIARGAKIPGGEGSGRLLYTHASKTYTVCSAPNGLFWRKTYFLSQIAREVCVYVIRLQNEGRRQAPTLGVLLSEVTRLCFAVSPFAGAVRACVWCSCGGNRCVFFVHTTKSDDTLPRSRHHHHSSLLRTLSRQQYQRKLFDPNSHVCWSI